MCQGFDTMMASFPRSFKATISTFPSDGKQKGQAAKEGSVGVLGLSVWTKTWHRTCTELPLCESSTALHHAVNWRLYWEGLTTQVYREHMSPLTLESFATAQAATSQSVLVGGLFF